MNYEVLDNFDAIIGTSYKGRIKSSYYILENKFGEPLRDEDGNVNWIIKFEDGTVATIYNWHDAGSVYDIDTWNVGGFEKTALFNVLDILTYSHD